jgi:hypothetical protein
MSNNEFADLLTNAYTKHPRVISLFSILYSVLEKRSSIDALACFKEGLLKKNTVLLDELQRLFPNASNKQLTLFFTIQLATAIGLYPMTHPSENQLCALKKINKKNEFQSFESLFKESILIHINTL